MKHTQNGIDYHRAATGCAGTFTKEISDKGDKGAFELFRCNGTHTKGRMKGQKCNYAGRGAQVRVGPKADREDPCAEDDLQCNGEELKECDAPVAELDESETE